MKPTSPAPVLNRTEMYEYACDLTRIFIDREAVVAKRAETSIDIFSPESFLARFFMIEISGLADPQYVAKIIDVITPAKQERRHDTTLVRLNQLLLDITISLGNDFIEQVIDDTVKYIVRPILRPETLQKKSFFSKKPAISKTEIEIRSLLRKLPILILPVFGFKYFVEKMSKSL